MLLSERKASLRVFRKVKSLAKPCESGQSCHYYSFLKIFTVANHKRNRWCQSTCLTSHIGSLGPGYDDIMIVTINTNPNSILLISSFPQSALVSQSTWYFFSFPGLGGGGLWKTGRRKDKTWMIRSNDIFDTWERVGVTNVCRIFWRDFSCVKKGKVNVSMHYIRSLGTWASQLCLADWSNILT